MFEKVTSEETAPIDYEERQALLNEIAEEEEGEEETTSFSFDGTLEEADLELPF